MTDASAPPSTRSSASMELDNETTKMTIIYVASQELVKYSSLLPSNKRRSAMVHTLTNSIGLFSPDYSPTHRLQLVNPIRATRRDLSLYHTAEYIDFILDSDSPTNLKHETKFGLQDDCPRFPGLSDYVQLVAGASLTAVRKLAEVDVTICWDGGRHHAQKDRASGFCYIADCILTILSLKRLPANTDHRSKIMYLDLDLHFSDAVSQAFYNRSSSSQAPQVLTLSIHHAAPGFFPPSQLSSLPRPGLDPFTLSLPLKEGATSETYARIWMTVVEKIKDAFQPDYTVVQCGVDSLAGDPYGIFNWSLKKEQEGSLGWCIDRIIHRWSGKKVLLGGGGYNSSNAARAWAYLTSIALNKPLTVETDIPDHVFFPAYAPSFTLDVPEGNMQDTNSEEYLAHVEDRFQDVINEIKMRMG